MSPVTFWVVFLAAVGVAAYAVDWLIGWLLWKMGGTR